MTRVTLENLKESLEVYDRYFVNSNDPTSHVGVDGSVANAELQRRETEETGRPLVEILADLRVAGSL